MFESDYLERDPYKKLATGLAHAFFAGFLVICKVPIVIIVVGYALWEIVAHLNLFRSREWLRWADSAVDLAFTYLGAAMVAYMDARYGFGALAMGGAYFLTESYFNGGDN